MHSAEVIEHVVQRNRVTMVGKFLTESICQAGEPAHVHPHGQVLPFDKTCAYVFRIGIATDDFHVRTDALGRAVARFRLSWRDEL